MTIITEIKLILQYSILELISEKESTIVGPGSERGIKKCFENLEGMSKEDIIKWMCNHQEEEFDRLGINFKSLGGRKLQYIDCQGLFCELDKYCTQAVPDLKSNRSKIKKKYMPKDDKIEYRYPPKWNVNI